ncbi:hypothetical protein BH10PSE4_BH10PSE4_45040 [soil metagenome]
MVEQQLAPIRRPWARQASRRAIRADRKSRSERLGWIGPGLALAAPLAGEAAGDYLLACLALGALLGLWIARRTGALWPALAWSLITGALAVALWRVEVPALPDLTLMTLAAATAQGLALLGVGAPATIAGWRARGLILLSLAGPLALALLAIQGAPAWGAFAAALAVGLDLAALPLALMARRRARS